MSMFRIFTPRRLGFAALALVTCVAGALSFNAANAENAPAPAALDAAQTVTDVAGRTVKIPENPKRILLGESRLLMALALLEGDHPLANIVGWQGDLKNRDPQTFDAYARKFPQINDIPLIGKATEDSISDEKALSLKPDLAIFTFGGEGPGRYNALVKQLEATGTVVVFVDFRIHPMQNTLASMKLLGEVLHRNEQADAYIKFYKEHLARVQGVVAPVPQAQRPKVFIDMLAGSWGVCCHTAGNGSFGEFIKVAGGRNIAADLLPGVLGDISMEQLIVAKPDIYVADGTWSRPGVAALHVGALTSEQDAQRSLSALVARPGYDAIQAIHDGRVFGIWHNYYDSPYNIIAIEAFAKWFYPAQFKDLSVKATHDEMYRRFLAVPSDGTYWVDHPAPAKG